MHKIYSLDWDMRGTKNYQAICRPKNGWEFLEERFLINDLSMPVHLRTLSKKERIWILKYCCYIYGNRLELLWILWELWKYVRLIFLEVLRIGEGRNGYGKKGLKWKKTRDSKMIAKEDASSLWNGIKRLVNFQTEWIWSRGNWKSEKNHVTECHRSTCRVMLMGNMKNDGWWNAGGWEGKA